MFRRAFFSAFGAIPLVWWAVTGTVEAPPVGTADVFLKPDTQLLEGLIARNATLAGVLRAHGVAGAMADRAVSAAARVFDLRQVQFQRRYRLVRTVEGSLRAFFYEIDADHYLRIAAMPGESTDVVADILPYKKDIAVAGVIGRIDRDAPSLFAAMEAAGEGPDLSVALAEIFAGEVDFNSDLQPGDSFSLSFEKVYREGQFAGYGVIRAAELRSSGRRLQAVLFAPSGGRPGYYDERGRSLRRFFLRSPLRFQPQVTSGFSASRLHPVLRTYRAHLGVDYRAPAGAPVIAVADGVVVAAGYSGSSGRMVHLRHSGGYESLYLHLSSIARPIRPGARVVQGQQIGRVGASGLATAPHLDYRVKKNGRFVNPLIEQRRLPPGQSIPAAVMPVFAQARDRALVELAGFEGAALATASPGAGEGGRSSAVTPASRSEP